MVLDQFEFAELGLKLTEGGSVQVSALDGELLLDLLRDLEGVIDGREGVGAEELDHVGIAAVGEFLADLFVEVINRGDLLTQIEDQLFDIVLVNTALGLASSASVCLLLLLLRVLQHLKTRS